MTIYNSSDDYIVVANDSTLNSDIMCKAILSGNVHMFNSPTLVSVENGMNRISYDQ